MKNAYVLLISLALSTGCTKTSSVQVNIDLKSLSYKWRYTYLSRCPYNPNSLAPCYIFSIQDESYWNPDSSFLIIDTTGNCYQNISGVNSLADSFHVVQINDSLFHITSPSWQSTTIKVKALQEHLLVLDYTADPFNTVYEIDSLTK